MSSANLYETEHSRNKRVMPRTTLSNMPGKNLLGSKTVELKRETISMTSMLQGKLSEQRIMDNPYKGFMQTNFGTTSVEKFKSTTPLIPIRPI